MTFSCLQSASPQQSLAARSMRRAFADTPYPVSATGSPHAGKTAMRLACTALLMAWLSCASAAAALEITEGSWNGHEAILLTGTIELGDAPRLIAALDELESMPHGAKLILLDSPGGSVGAALAISAALDRLPGRIHMLIPAGRRCASACASILFIAGDYRMVEEGGFLGQHSCASPEGTPSSTCNEVVAQHGYEHGVSHGSIAAFITQVPPEDILWFSREDAECWGLARYPFTEESGFFNVEPCFLKVIGVDGRPPQQVWRVDFEGDGYRAFTRSLGDHLREGQLSLFCDEQFPGRLFLSLETAGEASVIEASITGIVIEADPVGTATPAYLVQQMDEQYSRIIVALPPEATLDILQRACHFQKTTALYVRSVQHGIDEGLPRLFSNGRCHRSYRSQQASAA